MKKLPNGISIHAAATAIGDACQILSSPHQSRPRLPQSRLSLCQTRNPKAESMVAQAG
jgi:hypothetical protein